MSTLALLEKTNIPQRDSPVKIHDIRYNLPNIQKMDRPGWIPSEIIKNWNTDPYAYQTEEELMPQGGPHGQLLSYLSELLRSYLASKNLMLLIDSFMLYRDQKGIKQRIGPDLLFMPYQKPTPSSYDLDIQPPPECIIEITSPDSHDKDLHQNLLLYADLGIKTYLVIDLMIPNRKQVREQIKLHLFRLAKGQFIEQNTDPEGYLTLPEIGLKMKAFGQEIQLVEQQTGQQLLDNSNLKTALDTETQRANTAEQQVERLTQLLREQGIDPDKE